MRLRQANPNDAIELAKLYDLVWSAEVSALGERLAHERAAKADEVRRWIKADPYYVIEEEHKLVAVMGCEERLGTIHLVHLVVHPEYRRRGYAVLLMKKVESLARERGAVKLWFDTAPGLGAARKLYESLGFVQCGYLHKHYWGTDVVLYEKVL
jgi:GNAT superfamily N-acetyltransferase